MSIPIGELVPNGFKGRYINQTFNSGDLINQSMQGEFETCNFYNIEFNKIDINSKFINCRFIECRFISCNLSNVYFGKGTFSQCSLETSVFSNTNLKGVAFDSTKIFFVKFQTVIFEKCSFELSFSKGVEFILETEINNCKFSKYEFVDCLFNDFKFTNAFQINESVFVNTTLEKGRLVRGTIYGTTFTRTNFRSLVFELTTISEATFSDNTYNVIKFSNVNWAMGSGFPFDQIENFNIAFDGGCGFENLNLNRVNFSNANLIGSSFVNCSLIGSIFTHTDLVESKFVDCDISEADFRYGRFNRRTTFSNVVCNNTRFELYQLKKLENYGGFSEGQLADLFQPEDGLFQLKENFTGFLQWIHLLSIVAFLSPYIGYLAYLGVKSRFFTSGTNTDPSIISVFWEYIYSGAEMDSEINLIALSIFFLLLLYNVARLILLYKTKQLELKQNSLGFMVRFSIDTKISLLFGLFKMKYSQLLNFVHYGFLVNLILVFIHVILFLMKTVHL